MTLLLNCRKLAKAFGDLRVLRNVQLGIAKGDRIGLVGCNGTGKTTLAELLYGTLKPDTGVITCFADSIDIGYLRNRLRILFKRSVRCQNACRRRRELPHS